MTVIGKLSCCPYFDPQVFSYDFLLCSVEEEGDRVAGWAPGSQPRLSHHRETALVDAGKKEY